MRILVTGAAGFIGMHVAIKLLRQGHSIIGLDNINNYYDIRLKHARLSQISAFENFDFHKLDLVDSQSLSNLLEKEKPEIVINLAAQAGVRFSIEDPQSFINSNLVGFANILESCRQFKVKHLIYASSSSVYGLNEEMPFNEGQNTDHPVALYGATKKANELMAHSYSHLFGLPTTGLRFFTVYGPWGRPDMALFKFADAIMSDKPITIYNHGNMIRDFTYIDDIVEGIVRLAVKPATADVCFDAIRPDPGKSSSPWRIFNIGNGKPTPLMEYVVALETALGKDAKKVFIDMQPGDVVATSSDTSRLNEWVGFKPNTPIVQGIENFVEWYFSIYQNLKI